MQSQASDFNSLVERDEILNRTCAVLFVVALTGSCQASAASSTTRIEENDASIQYSGTWYTNPSSANSGGSAALTNFLGARATVTFNGTGFTWYGVADPWSGVARLYLDGTLSTVDTYGATTEYQHVLFTARGLAPGPHTVSIEVAHMRDSNAMGSWIWLDYFAIENGSGVTGGITASAGRIEQNDPALIYSGTWFLNTNPIQSGGTAALAVDPNSSVTINFTRNRNPLDRLSRRVVRNCKIYLDGSVKDVVDTYLSPDQAQATIYSFEGLPMGNHTLTITATGTRPFVTRLLDLGGCLRCHGTMTLAPRLVYNVVGARPNFMKMAPAGGGTAKARHRPAACAYRPTL